MTLFLLVLSPDPKTSFLLLTLKSTRLWHPESSCASRIYRYLDLCESPSRDPGYNSQVPLFLLIRFFWLFLVCPLPFVLSYHSTLKTFFTKSFFLYQLTQFTLTRNWSCKRLLLRWPLESLSVQDSEIGDKGLYPHGQRGGSSFHPTLFRPDTDV